LLGGKKEKKQSIRGVRSGKKEEQVRKKECRESSFNRGKGGRGGKSKIERGCRGEVSGGKGRGGELQP